MTSIRFAISLAITLTLLSTVKADDCPYTPDLDFSINSTFGYQFFILQQNNVTINESSLSIATLGFYDSGNCIQSNATNLIAVPFNSSLLVSTFFQATQSQVCVVFSVCNENDTCCSNGTVVFNVTDRPTCSPFVQSILTYIYNTNTTFNLTQYFILPTNPVTFIEFLTEPMFGEFTLDPTQFTYQQTGNFSDYDSFSVMICNEFGLCSNCSFNISGVHPPICRDDQYSVLFSDIVELTPLANDSYTSFIQGIAFSGLTVTPFENTTGVFVPTSNGTVIYSHGTNFTTFDGTEYTLCNVNYGLCDVCYIRLRLHSGITCADQSFTVFSLVPALLDIAPGIMDIEFPDPTDWSFEIIRQFVSGNGTIYANATLSITSDLILGNDSLIYVVTDPFGYNSTCAVDLTVLWLPICGNANVSVPFQTNTAINVTTFDSNPAGPILNTTLGLYLFSNNTQAGGTVWVNGSFVIGVNYLPPVSYSGPDSFPYRLCDSTMSCVNCTFNLNVLQAVTTAIPTTAIPTTAVPTTSVVSTTASSTGTGTTATPTTSIPTTAVPTTATPTTSVITTAQPTTGMLATTTGTSNITTSNATTSVATTGTISPTSSSGLSDSTKLAIILVPVSVFVIGGILLIIALAMACVTNPKLVPLDSGDERGAMLADVASSKKTPDRLGKRKEKHNEDE